MIVSIFLQEIFSQSLKTNLSIHQSVLTQAKTEFSSFRVIYINRA